MKYEENVKPRMMRRVGIRCVVYEAEVCREPHWSSHIKSLWLRHRLPLSNKHNLLYIALLQTSMLRSVVAVSHNGGLDDEPPSPRAPRVPGFIRDMKPVHHSLAATATGDDHRVSGSEERPNPNINGFGAALSCYL
jgi:hypothetical protein